MKSTLALVTRPLKTLSAEVTRLVLRQADQVVLIADGVYNSPYDGLDKDVYGMPGGHRSIFSETESTAQWPIHWHALEDDVVASKVETDIQLINDEQLIDAIEKHEKIVTL